MLASLRVSKSEAESSDSSMSLGKLLKMLDIFVRNAFPEGLESLEESCGLWSSELALVDLSGGFTASVSVLAIALTLTTELVTAPASACGCSFGTDGPLENRSDLASVLTLGKSSTAGTREPMPPEVLMVTRELLSGFFCSDSDATWSTGGAGFGSRSISVTSCKSLAVLDGFGSAGLEGNVEAALGVSDCWAWRLSERSWALGE